MLTDFMAEISRRQNGLDFSFFLILLSSTFIYSSSETSCIQPVRLFSYGLYSSERRLPLTFVAVLVHRQVTFALNFYDIISSGPFSTWGERAQKRETERVRERTEGQHAAGKKPRETSSTRQTGQREKNIFYKKWHGKRGGWQGKGAAVPAWEQLWERLI